MSHSPEPWNIGGIPDDAKIVAADGTFIAGDEGFVRMDDPNYQRIIACVNFCRNLPTNFLQGQQLVTDSDDGSGVEIYRVFEDKEAEERK